MAGVANAGMAMPLYQGGQETLGAISNIAEHDPSLHMNNHQTQMSAESQQEIVGQEVVQQPAEDAPVIDIVINNVVCSFATRCHLNLKRLAMEGANVIYKRENGMVNMKIRKPMATASIWSSGKVTCTGATSEEDSRLAARRIARKLQNLGFRVKFSNFRVVNVLGTCSFPFGIRITHFSRDHPQNSSYEPELHPGVTYRIKEPKATLKIFSTGSITVTAPSVLNVQCAIEHIYPLVVAYKMEDQTPIKQEGDGKIEQQMHLMPKRRNVPKSHKKRRLDNPSNFEYDSDNDDFLSDTSDEEEDDFDSDASQD